MTAIVQVKRYVYFTLILILLLSSTGCRNYSISVNNNVVYLPPPILKEFSIPDEHLRGCVEQTILDKHITQVPQLTALNCSHAGIKELSGLEKFYNLQQLNLAENEITSVAPLNQLAQVRVLILGKNNIKDPAPLLAMLQLSELDVSDNKEMNCNDLRQLIRNFATGQLKSTLPEQCRKN